MDNEIKLKRVFAAVLRVAEDKVGDGLEYGKDWNSLSHMALVAALEEAFDVMFSTEDVIDMSSYAKVRTIVGRYGIAF